MQARPSGSRAGFSRRLWVKLLLAYLLPAALILTGIGYLAYRAARRAMEGQLGEGLVATARTAANLMGKPRSMRLVPGDEYSRTYTNLKEKLRELKEAAQAELVYLFDVNGKALVDSEGRYSIGESIVRLAADRAELKDVFSGEVRSSVLFEGTDGRLFKTGFAPVRVGGAVVGAVGVDGSARFFEPLGDLSRTLALVSLVALVLVVLVTLFVSRLITRPLDRLAQSARAIGRGELAGEIRVETRDEIGVLAHTLNEMRESIRERDQQLQMMLSGIAHEVRNPLGGIALFVGLLKEELSDHPSGAGHLKRIETELDYLSRVVNDFLDFARERPVELEQLDPRTEFEQIQNLTVADLQQAGLDLVARVSEDIRAVEWDRERMRRALINLIRNAIQASAKGDTIEVILERGGDELVLSVSDRGCGVPEKERDRIFDSFFTTRQQGTGLGLALVKKIVEAHGGSISLQSKPGRGTTFTLRLPARKAEACPAS
jgi:signal transduction histidine kinase